MGGIKRKPKTGEGTSRDAGAFIPSAIHVDHRRNYSRELLSTPDELKPYLPDGCCFTLAEIEERLASMQKHTQIDAVSIYLTLTGDAYLVDGYLRHAAFLLAEVRGLLGTIPKSGGKIRCDYVTEPKSEADWLALAERNYEENTARKGLSCVDKARYAAGLMAPPSEGGFGLTAEQAAQRIGLTNTRQLDRYLRLLKLPPTVRADLRSGKITMSAALADSSKTGQAGSPGPRPGIKSSTVKRALSHVAVRPLPTRGLSAKDTAALLGIMTGAAEIAEDDMSDALAEWLRAINMPAEEAQALAAKADDKPRKKSPRKPGADKEAA